jgi:acyl-CoA thioesterase
MGKVRYLEQVRKVANSSPYHRLLGIEATEIREGESRIQMLFKQELTHPYGIVHGGAIASLADSAVAMALISLVEPKDRITTIEFKINFFVPVSKGELKAHAKIIHKGSKTAVGDVEVINEGGELVAKVMATYSIMRGDESWPVVKDKLP